MAKRGRRRSRGSVPKGAAILAICAMLAVALALVQVATAPPPPTTTTSITSTVVTTIYHVQTTIYTTHPNVTVAIDNGKDSAAQPGFQQRITIGSGPLFQNMSADGGNVRFYIGQQMLYSWRENATVWWIRMPYGIPANSEVNVNMSFLPSYEEYDGYYAGEAPQLSAAYGQYDNGANIFDNYTRFGGNLTALPAGWTNDGSSLGFAQDGVLINTSASRGISSPSPYSQSDTPFILDVYGRPTGTTDFRFGLGGSATYTIGSCNTTTPQGIDIGTDESLFVSGECGVPGVSIIPTAESDTVYSLGYISADEAGGEIDYKYIVLNASSQSPYAYLAFSSNQESPATFWLYWTRFRAYPPGGMMPSVSFSSPPSLSPPYPSVGINIVNTQEEATPADFQQMIAINSSAAFQNVSDDGGNVRFYMGSQELYSWRENSTVWWVLIPNGIPAYSAISISMSVLPKSAEYDGVYAGEAPQLSAAYAEYDNGASVFKSYWNFAGTSLPSGWVQSNGGTRSYRVDDGVYVSENPDYQNVYYATPQTLSPSGIVLDICGNYSTNSTNVGFGMPYLNGVAEYDGAWVWYNGTDNKFGLNEFDGDIGIGVDSPVTFNTAERVWTMYSEGSGIVLLDNYASKMTNDREFGTLTRYIGLNQEYNATATLFAQWIRTRAVPPGGVMPRAVLYAPVGAAPSSSSSSTTAAGVTTTARSGSVVQPQVVNTIGVGYGASSVAMAQDGKELFVTGEGSVLAINTTTDRVANTIAIQGPSVPQPDGVAVSPDGTRAYATYYNASYSYATRNASVYGWVSVIDATTDRIIKNIGVGIQPTAIEVSPKGDRIYAVNTNSNTVSVIGASTGDVVDTIWAGTHPDGLALSADGAYLYVSGGSPEGSGSVSAVSTSTGAVASTATVGAGPSGIAVDPTSGYVYVANYFSGTVSVIDASSGKVVRSITVGSNPVGIAITPDGAYAYVADSGYGTVSVIDTSTGAVVDTLNLGGGGANGVAISPDGTRAYVTNMYAGTVSVIDTGSYG
jgi:YVTN family beta-propeller protein